MSPESPVFTWQICLPRPVLNNARTSAGGGNAAPFTCDVHTSQQPDQHEQGRTRSRRLQQTRSGHRLHVHVPVYGSRVLHVCVHDLTAEQRNTHVMCISTPMYMHAHTSFSLLGTVIVPISSLRKPRLREAQYLARDHRGLTDEPSLI